MVIKCNIILQIVLIGQKGGNVEVKIIILFLNVRIYMTIAHSLHMGHDWWIVGPTNHSCILYNNQLVSFKQYIDSLANLNILKCK